MQNCANGHTPWGTYLTCEENWSDILSKADLNPLEKRYGISDSDESYRWNEVDERFSVDKTLTNPTVSAGWWRSILQPDLHPAQAHRARPLQAWGAAVTLAADNRVVVYMGDDQKFEYIYKFVSDKNTIPRTGKPICSC